MRRRSWGSAGLVGCLVAIGLWSAAEGAGPWRGQVLDEDTGQPLEGVVVVARWDKVSPGAMHPAREFHDADEAVTDAEGRFELPARNLMTLNPFVSIEGPRIMMFKAGYGIYRFRGTREWRQLGAIEETKRVEKARREFGTTGVQFEMPPLKTIQERRKFASYASAEVDVHTARAPKFFDVLNQERAFLKLQPTDP